MTATVVLSKSVVAELVRSSMALNLSITGTEPCFYCGVMLNVEPIDSPHDGRMVTDLVPIGAGKAIGHRHACRTCAEDPEMAAARVRRKRAKRHRGNFKEMAE